MTLSETRDDNKGLLDLQSGIERFSAIVAPITIVTALLVYVGWTRNRAYFGFFGIDQGILGLSVQDYVLRSADVTFAAVARLLAAALVFVILDRLLAALMKKEFDNAQGPSLNQNYPEHPSDGAQRNDMDEGEYPKKANTNRLHLGLNWISPSLTILGVALSVIGLFFALNLTGGLDVSPLLGPGILGVGAILTLRFGSTTIFRLSKSRSLGLLGHLMLLFTLVLALFWAATLYAQDLGQQAARIVDSSPAALPLVTVFSNSFLDIPGSRVRVNKVAGPEGVSYYRYTGLSSLAYSNSRWFLITGRYSGHYRSSITVLRDSESIRVEVAAVH